MNLDTAPSVAYEDDEECNNCGATNSFVLYDNDKVCTECQHAPQTDATPTTTDAWVEWWEHRDANYSGFYGSERIKMVGGFTGPYPKL